MCTVSNQIHSTGFPQGCQHQRTVLRQERLQQSTLHCLFLLCFRNKDGFHRIGVIFGIMHTSGNRSGRWVEILYLLRMNKRFYIQSALSIADPDKKEQEIESLKRIPDSFSKMVVVRDYLKPWQDENGITYVGIEQFLLNEELLK